jgi:hypothetical protein
MRMALVERDASPTCWPARAADARHEPFCPRVASCCDGGRSDFADGAERGGAEVLCGRQRLRTLAGSRRHPVTASGVLTPRSATSTVTSSRPTTSSIPGVGSSRAWERSWSRLVIIDCSAPRVHPSSAARLA